MLKISVKERKNSPHKRSHSVSRNSLADKNTGEMGLDRGQLKKELSKFTRQFLIYMVLAVTDMVLGSLLFLYIEHCYDVVSKTYRPMENSYLEICNILEHKTNTSVSVGGRNDNDTKQMLTEMQEICNRKSMYIEHIVCELNQGTFSKWFEYTASIGFTVGKLVQSVYGHGF